MRNAMRFVLGCFCLTLISCSMASDVHDTDQTSHDIKSISQDLDNNSKDLKNDSHYIADGTGKIYNGGLKDLSYERPEERLNELKNDTGNTDKIRDATALCQSFAFQQWTGTGDDTIAKKQQLYAKAMESFFAMFDSLINHNYQVDTSIGPIPGPPDSRWLTLAAVGVAMSVIDPDQQAASDANHIDADSIYSLIVKGLGMKAAVNAGKTIPDYAKQVLDWEDEAVFLLQLRHNFFPAMVLSRFSDFASGFDKEAAGVLLGINVTLPPNASKIQDQGIFWLQESQETQRTLVKLGYPLQFNKPILTAFSKTTFAVPSTMQATPQLTAVINQLNQIAGQIVDTFKTGTIH